MSRLPPEGAQGGDPHGSPPTFATIELLQRAKDGDTRALEHIMERYLPRLQRWARGRLPNHARSLLDTSDLVQETLARTLQGLDRVEVRGRGGFEAYVRKAVLNGVKDQIRRAGVRGPAEEVPTDLVTPVPSPLEHAIGADLLDRYERALATLDTEDQQLLHLRIELEFDYGEIAAMTGRPSPDAARMAFQRALGRLAEAMGHERRE
jgi:RNA polymerase sigma-70 factor (ECF subfamily)